MAGAGTPQLQLDLVSLSSFVTNIGSRGLKQLATSGVDLHSLGCMLMIANLAPASRDFRMTLSRIRQQQRSWIYKAVEIGAGSNFLVDQLLKTRAGENVIALMTAIAPITNEASCTLILSSLFDTAGVSLDNTPGMDEFRKVRSALLPLSRKSEFKERVLQFQHLLQTFVHDSQFQADRDPYDAMPHDKDFSTIILMLSTVASDNSKTFTYNGIQGAGWVATYASYVLGLPTCAINASGQTLPISGNYEQARVVIRPLLSATMQTPQTCNVSKAGDILQFIALEQSDAIFPRSSWGIDCSIVNFLEMHHPGLRQKRDYPIICVFTAQGMMNKATELAEAFSDEVENVEPFVPYTLSVLSDIRSRGLKILKILGFECGTLEDYIYESRGGCQDYYCTGPRRSIQDNWTLPYRFEPSHYEPVFPQENALDAWEPYDHYRGEDLPMAIFEDYLRRYPWLNPDQQSKLTEGNDTSPRNFAFPGWSLNLQSRVLRTMQNAAFMAAELAFTNWDISIRSLSIDSFHRFHERKTIKPDLASATKKANEYTSDGTGFEGHLARAILLCTNSLKPTVLEKRLLDWVAIDIDGITVVKSSVTNRSITKLRGEYLQFHQGHIFFDGVARHDIRAETDTIDSTYTTKDDSIASHSIRENSRDCSQSLGPDLNTYFGQSVLSVRSRQHFTVDNDTIWLRLEYENAKYVWTQMDPSRIAKAIPKLLVTAPCMHPSSTPVQLHGWSRSGSNPNLRIEKWISVSPLYSPSGKIPESVSLTSAIDLSELGVIYSMVADCEEAQWLSCILESQTEIFSILDGIGPNHKRRRTPETLPKILQKDTCLLCTVHQLDEMKRKTWPLPSCDSSGLTPTVCIIPCNSNAPNPSLRSTATGDFRSCQKYHSVKIQRGGDSSGTQTNHSSSDILHTPCCLEKREIPCYACVPPVCSPEDSCEDCCQTLPRPRVLRQVKDPKESSKSKNSNYTTTL